MTTNDDAHVRLPVSLRDYFAGQALIGLLANTRYELGEHVIVGEAYRCADAMLAEREGTNDD